MRLNQQQSLSKHDLPKRRLGTTKLVVTRLGYGSMELRGSRVWKGRRVDGRTAERLLNSVLDYGINFIDTASVYGASEALIGKYLSHRRLEFFLATKCGWTVERFDEDTDLTPHVWTRKNILNSVEQSLRRMRTDYIDLIQLHNPTPEECEHGDLVNTLERLREQGKIRSIGTSTKIPDVLSFLGLGVFQTFQIPYSALRREHENYITEIGKQKAGIIVRGGLANGEPGLGQGIHRFWNKYRDARLDDLREVNESKTAFLLRFALSHNAVDTVIVGTLQVEHLREGVEAALNGRLREDVYIEALRRLEVAGVSAPAIKSQS
jgi:aryl-alcohol dehydrogenase-like predicted oxidoreductase